MNVIEEKVERKKIENVWRVKKYTWKYLMRNERRKKKEEKGGRKINTRRRKNKNVIEWKVEERNKRKRLKMKE